MKLFDYKFLILLGSVVAIYFIYRETRHLRRKIESLEIKCLEIKYQKNNIENRNITLASQNTNNKNLQVESKENKVDLNIPLDTKNLEQYLDTQNLEQYILDNIEDYDDSDTDTNFSDNDSDEKVEIYSNDNENYDDISIDTSSILETDGYKVIGSNNEVINSINKLSEDEENINEDFENINEDFENINECLFEENTSENNNLLGQNESLEESKKKNTVVKFEGIKDKDVNVDQNEIFNYENLMKYKLNHLQCLAEERKIELNKKNNKRKTKSELSNDLINYNN